MPGVASEASRDTYMHLIMLVHEWEVPLLQSVPILQSSSVTRQDKLADFAPKCSAGTFQNCWRGYAMPGESAQAPAVQYGSAREMVWWPPYWVSAM